MSRPSSPRAPHRPYRRPIGVAIVLAVLLLAIGLPFAPTIGRVAGGHAELEFAKMGYRGAATDTYAVNMTDTPRFVPAMISGVHAGDNVSVQLHNGGSFAHSFTVLRHPGITLNASSTPAQLNASVRANGTLADVLVAPGASGWANFSIPANATGGSFQFLSTVPFQYQAGMAGAILVSAGTPAASLNEQATANLAFLPDQLVVNATTYPVTIAITVTNVGALIHTWTLSPLANVVITPGNFTSFFSSHAPAANLVMNNPGQVVNGSFLLNSPGVYQYICTEPGHFAGGMSGFLYVGVAPPSVAAPPSTEIVQVGILAGAGTLVGVAVILAFASNYVGRFPPRTTGHP